MVHIIFYIKARTRKKNQVQFPEQTFKNQIITAMVQSLLNYSKIKCICFLCCLKQFSHLPNCLK